MKDDAKGLGRHIVMIHLLKDFVLCGGILEFLKVTEIQILAPLVYELFLMVLVAVYRPLKSREGNFFIFVEACSEFLVLVVFLIFLVFGGKSERFKYNVLGNLMIVVIGLIFLAFALIGVVSTVKSILGFFQGNGSSGGSSGKVRPIGRRGGVGRPSKVGRRGSGRGKQVAKNGPKNHAKKVKNEEIESTPPQIHRKLAK